MAETGETAQTQLIYGRDDRPSFGPSLLAAFATWLQSSPVSSPRRY